MSENGPIVVSGATGLVGSRLVEQLLDRGAAVTALTRNPDGARDRVDERATLAAWDGRAAAAPLLDGASAVVHLAGEPVFGGPLTASRRDRILRSRVDSTLALVEGLAALEQKRRPATFVCASAVGIYGSRGDELLDEQASAGEGFLADVCRAWEEAASRAEAVGVRRVSMRIGIVLSRAGGALPMMSLPFRIGFGGRLGDGKQWFPWIALDDLTRLIIASLEDARYTGAVNAVAPNPVTNAELTRAIASTLRRPALIPVPRFAIRAALGELSGELLGSRRVTPTRATELGFRFETERLEDALAEELGRAD